MSNKIEELKEMIESIGKKDDKKKVHTLVWVLAIIGAVAAVAAIAYAVYRYFNAEVEEEMEDEFDEDFDDDFFEDEDCDPIIIPKQEAVEVEETEEEATEE